MARRRRTGFTRGEVVVALVLVVLGLVALAVFLGASRSLDAQERDRAVASAALSVVVGVLLTGVVSVAAAALQRARTRREESHAEIQDVARRLVDDYNEVKAARRLAKARLRTDPVDLEAYDALVGSLNGPQLRLEALARRRDVTTDPRLRAALDDVVELLDTLEQNVNDVVREYERRRADFVREGPRPAVKTLAKLDRFLVTDSFRKDFSHHVTKALERLACAVDRPTGG